MVECSTLPSSPRPRFPIAYLKLLTLTALLPTLVLARESTSNGLPISRNGLRNDDQTSRLGSTDSSTAFDDPPGHSKDDLPSEEARDPPMILANVEGAVVSAIERALQNDFQGGLRSLKASIKYRRVTPSPSPIYSPSFSPSPSTSVPSSPSPSSSIPETPSRTPSPTISFEPTFSDRRLAGGSREPNHIRITIMMNYDVRLWHVRNSVKSALQSGSLASIFARGTLDVRQGSNMRWHVVKIMFKGWVSTSWANRE